MTIGEMQKLLDADILFGKELLDMDGFDLLVCVKSYTYLEDATLFQYTESKHRPDKFRFVEFARRSHIDY